LPASPLPKGFLPRVKVRPGAYLYPAEDRALLACKDVPLVNRILYGFLAREGMRREEALSLSWDDLDLDLGAVRLDTNKTDDPRAWALDPGTAATLRWWKDRCTSAKVFGDVIDPGHLADVFREHLRSAKVTRPELFEHNEKRRQINVHGLRATFVTLSLANGKSEAWVQDRTGHRSSIMVNRYRRVARTAAELGLGPLTPLDKAIPELRKKARRSRAPAAA
jgi:integrase